MAEDIDKLDVDEVTDDDRLWATLAWIPIIWPIIAVIVLFILFGTIATLPYTLKMRKKTV